MSNMINRRQLLGYSSLGAGASLMFSGCAALSPYPIPDPDRQGIHHVALFVSDVEKSADFYASALGCKRVYAWQSEVDTQGVGAGPMPFPGVFMDTGDGSLLALRAGKAAAAGTAVLQHFAMRVADCASSYRRARAAGASTHTIEHAGGEYDGRPVTINLDGDPPASATVAFVTGPDGEVIEFFQSTAFVRPTDAPLERSEYDRKAPGRY